MRRTMTIAGVLALAGTCLLAQEPRTGDTRTEDRTGAAATTLPLRLQQGQTFEFRLQVNEKPSQKMPGIRDADDRIKRSGQGQDPSRGEGREESGVGARGETRTGAGETRTGETKSGETRTGETKSGDIKTGEARTGESKTGMGETGLDKTRLGGSEAIVGTLGNTQTCRLSLRIQEAAADGNATVEVRIRHESSDTVDTAMGRPDREIGKSKTFTARVDRDGRIVSLNESMASGTGNERSGTERATGDHAGTGKDHGTKDHGTKDHGTKDHGTKDHGTKDHGTKDHGTKTHGSYDPMSEEKVRYALQAIFGSGLHNTELRPGQVYVVTADASAARASGTGAERSERPVGEMDRAAGLSQDDHTVRLRFESAGTGTERVARFAILAPNAGISTLPGRGSDTGNTGGRDPARGIDPTDPSRNTDPATRTDRTAGDTARGLASDQGICGQATYRLDDGLLEELTINHDLGKKSGMETGAGKSETGKSETDATRPDKKTETGAYGRAGMDATLGAANMPSWVSIRRVSGAGLPTETERK